MSTSAANKLPARRTPVEGTVVRHQGRDVAQPAVAAPVPAASAAPAESTSTPHPSTPRARPQYRTEAAPPVREIPRRQKDTASRINAPRQVEDAAARGGGILLGLVAYAIGINYVRGGFSGIKQWFAAKFLNQATAGPGKASVIAPNAPVSPPPSTGTGGIAV